MIARMLSALLVVGLVGCTSPVFREPVTISTKALPLAQEPAGTFVSGRSCSRVTLLIIPISFGYSDAAFQRALAQAPGADTLINWRMRTDGLAVVGSLLYFQQCIEVEGFAVKSSELLARSEDKAATERALAAWSQHRERVVHAGSRDRAQRLAEAQPAALELAHH